MTETEPTGQKKPDKKIPVDEIQIRQFQKSDLDQMPALLSETLGRHVPTSWLDWKYFQIPFEGKLAFVVACYGDEIVGFIGANPVPFSFQGDLSLVYQHQDIAIDERCRSLKLLRSMIQACEDMQDVDKYDFTYSITTPHLRSLVTKRMKYTVVWENLKMTKLTSLRAYASKATKSSKLASLLPGPAAHSWKAPSSMTGDIRPLESFGLEFDTFWEKANQPSDEIGIIFPWQNADWLNYKFFQDEAVPFHSFAYYEGDEVIGYVVLNVTHLDVKIGFLDALWTLPGRYDVVKLLTDFAHSEFLQHKCDQINCWTQPNRPVGKALAEHGYAQRPTPMCLSIKQLHDGMGDLGLKGEHWNLQRGHTYYTSLGHLDVEEGQTRLAKVKEKKVSERRQKH